MTPIAASDRSSASAPSPRAGDPSLIRSLTPRGGQPVEVGPITVLVGPHNAGKTETLRDLLRLAANFELSGPAPASDRDPQPIVLGDLTFAPKLTVERLLWGLQVLDDRTAGEVLVQGLAPDLKTPLQRTVSKDLKHLLHRPVVTARSTWTSPLGQLMPLRMWYVDRAMHARLVEPSPACGPADGPQHLLQVLQDADAAVHQSLQAAFAEAFPGRHIKLDTSERVRLSLRVSSAPFPPDAPNPIINVRQHRQLRSLQEEGDACQRYVAVVLSLLLGAGRVVLLDHPEADLRPAQARQLGRWIAANAPAAGCQVFLTTSDSALLTGLLEARPDVAIVRLSRRDDVTRFQPVPTAPAQALVKVPLFACQDAVRWLFAEGVVVVPEERDQIVYQTVAAQLAPQNLGFLSAAGARNLAFAAGAIREAGLPVAVVSELDLFRSEKELVELVKAVTGTPPPQPWLAIRERWARHWEAAPVSGQVQDAPHAGQPLAVMPAPEASSAGHLAAPTSSHLTTLPESSRERRLEQVPRELRGWVEELLEDLKRKGLFLSPKGHLEGWLDVGVSHRTLWLNHAMQRLHRGECPADLRGFVGEIAAYLSSNAAPARLARLGDGTSGATPT